MNSDVFKIGGPFTDEDWAVYIEREADRKGLLHLNNMDYLLIIGPRQQGKTSLIYSLMRHLSLDDVVFLYVDVSDLKPSDCDRLTTAEWYQVFCSRLLRKLQGIIPNDQLPPIPQNSHGWHDFLLSLALFAKNTNKRFIFAIDEIGSLEFPGVTGFFSVLRQVFNSREPEPEFKQLTFLLAGAFHPQDLIRDENISPFNIAIWIDLSDFTLKQVHMLVSKGKWRDEQIVALANRIYYWTDGQPYLTQLLCSYLESDATPDDVDADVERLRREDENHLPPLIKRLTHDKKLCKYVERILSGERIRFYPKEHRLQSQLELLGVIKADPDGYCKIRNRIYEQSLRYSSQLSNEKTPTQNTSTNIDRASQKIIELQQKWSLLSQQLSRLEQDKILETRSDEKFRLEKRINEIKVEREQIEQQLTDLECQLPSDRKPAFINQQRRIDAVYDYKHTEWHSPQAPKITRENFEKFQGKTNFKPDILLMTATETELLQVLRLLKPLPSMKRIRHITKEKQTYYVGKFAALPAVVVRCEMGAVGRDAALNTARDAIELWRPKALIMVGIAFGADCGKHQPADVLIAEKIVPYESQRVGQKIIFRSAIPSSGQTLLNRFKNALGWSFQRPDGSRVRAYSGAILSGEKLIDDLLFKQELMSQFSEAIGGEMEGAGVYAAASHAKLEWILVKGVCDWADGEKHDGYQEMAAAAAASLTHFVLSNPDALDGL
jgi:nucleoside phosphorylase